jgi:hypothetical protein
MNIILICQTGLNNQQGLDIDAQTLLESLANYEHQPQTSEQVPPSSGGGDHFASLLEAAATAGVQDSTADFGRRRSTRQPRAPEYGFPESPERGNRTTRSSRVLEDDPHVLIPGRNRRKRHDSDEEEQLAREREIWGPEDDEETGNGSAVEPRYHTSPPIGASDARAAGVHSAAALFRRPSSASKKYTRPPMSKLFTSLELSPEDFLHLQAAAKAYMLDPEHPERRDCVGNRGRGDTDMVKLKLFECVKAFLTDEGWGDKCFGENAQGAETRKLKWPQMKNKVISLVTPLLRRMVTNERQRQYAIETRKSTNNTPKVANKRQNDQVSATPPRNSSQPLNDTVSQYPNIDPKLDPYHYNIDPSFASEDNQSPSKRQKCQAEITPALVIQPPGEEQEIKYHINLLSSSNTRLRPRATLTTASCPGFPSLVQHIHTLLNDDGEGQQLKSIKVLGVNGVTEVADDDAWLAAVKAIQETEWMDAEVRVLVEVARDV